MKIPKPQNECGHTEAEHLEFGCHTNFPKGKIIEAVDMPTVNMPILRMSQNLKEAFERGDKEWHKKEWENFIRDIRAKMAEEILKEVRGLYKPYKYTDPTSTTSVMNVSFEDMSFNSALTLVEEMLLAKMK